MKSDLLERLTEAATADSVIPVTVSIPEKAVADLRERLANARWPEAAPTGDGSQGVPLDWMQQLTDYWRSGYDLSRFADRLNQFRQYVTEVAGHEFHFIHVRSARPDARPLLMTHGWPGSVLEFMEVIAALADPDDANAPAFHIVCPSLPGYGLSEVPSEPGWGPERVADAWVELMGRLGYDRFIAQGGDWGSFITMNIATRQPDHLLGIHLNMAVVPPDPATEGAWTEQEQQAMDDAEAHLKTGRGYSEIQATRPQTIGYALVDSPIALAAWIADKYFAWTDHAGDPFSAVSIDDMLDNISLYWFTRTGASAGRMYWESYQTLPNRSMYRQAKLIEVPAAISIFPRELMRPSRRWCEALFTDLRSFENAPHGGHFAALEVPDVFVEHVRQGVQAILAG